MKTRIIQSDSHEPPSTETGPPARGVAKRRGGVFALMRRQPLLAFFALAFAITWAPVSFGVFMAGGPLVAALLVTAIVDGRRGLRELGSRIIRWRVGWQWYAAALLIPLGVLLGTGGLNVALGAPDSPLRDLAISSLVLAFAVRLVLPIFSPMGEEPGWRGFALPRLLAGRSPFVVTLFLGLVVAVWHVPLVFIASEDLAPIFLLATVAVTFFYTWLFVRSGGSVLITIIAHATEGTVVRELVGADGFVGTDETQFTLLYTAAWFAVAIGLLVFDRKLWRGRSPVTTFSPRSGAAVAGA